jgi:glycosyltransferase involved in cell wall biosynthesis
MPRKLLIIVDGLGLSGKTVSIVNLAMGLDSSHYCVEICALTEDHGSLSEQLKAAHIPIHYLSSQDGVNLLTIVRMWQLIHRLQPAVVHCYNSRPILYGAIAARLAGCDAIVGSLSAMASQVPDREYEFLPQQLSTLTVKNRWRNRLSVHLINKLCMLSPSLSERFCHYNKIPLTNVRIIPYGVAIPELHNEQREAGLLLRNKLGFHPEDVLICSMGRLIEQKDYEFQLRAFAQAAKKNPQLKMIIIGGGVLYQPICQLIDMLEIKNKVLMLGHRNDVDALYRLMDIFVLTSKFEPFGVALLEAKAYACAIIATSVNEIPEIIQHDFNGRLVASGDIIALANEMLDLAANPLVRERLATEARRDAEEKNSLAVMIANYQNLYDEILAQ